MSEAGVVLATALTRCEAEKKELLQACKNLLNNSLEGKDVNDVLVSACHIHWADELRKAIAKAEGK